MNKYFKGCLIVLGIIISIILIFIGGVWWSMHTSKQRAAEDEITFSKACDTTKIITAKPDIAMAKFRKKDIEELKFYIVRKNKIVKDTLVKNTITDENFFSTNIPFTNFEKSDTIIVVTKSKLYYKISGFHYYAYLHYGMFGYVGSHDCRFADRAYIVNGKANDGFLSKEDGIKENILPK